MLFINLTVLAVVISISYFGRAEFHYFRRMKEHLGLIKGAAPTVVTKHLVASENCKANNFDSSLSLLDNEASMHTRPNQL